MSIKATLINSSCQNSRNPCPRCSRRIEIWPDTFVDTTNNHTSRTLVTSPRPVSKVWEGTNPKQIQIHYIPSSAETELDCIPWTKADWITQGFRLDNAQALTILATSTNMTSWPIKYRTIATSLRLSIKRRSWARNSSSTRIRADEITWSTSMNIMEQTQMPNRLRIQQIQWAQRCCRTRN